MMSFPFAQLWENPSTEALTSGTGFVLDRPPGRTVKTLFAGLLHDQSAAPSFNLKNPLPDSLSAFQSPLDAVEFLFLNPGLPVDTAPLPYSEILGNIERLGVQKAEHAVSHFLSALPGGEAPLSFNTIHQKNSTKISSPTQLLIAGGTEMGVRTMSSGVQSPVSPSPGSSDVPGAESSMGTIQDGAKTPANLLRIVPGAGRQIPGKTSSPASMSQSLLKTSTNETVQTSFPISNEETQESLVETVHPNQYRLRFASSYVHAASDTGKASSVILPDDVFRDGSSSLTGDRKDGLNTLKMPAAVQLDGQSMQHGMGGFSHSQSGSQQSASVLSHGLGPGARMVEEGTNLPSPALQRLQLDVQLSETSRVQIDVGVQQRHVYAGLVMDQAALKNLAVQFIPQLEAQLAQKNMELQDFSADVRDHHADEQKPDDHAPLADRPGVRHRGLVPSHVSEPESRRVMQGPTPGLHLVA